MKSVIIAITAASYSGNKGAAAMLQSSIRQLYQVYGGRLKIKLMSVYPEEDQMQVPWNFVEVVSCKPEQLLFLAFPLAILYRLFSFLPPLRKLLLKNQILKAYSESNAVLDEAGISFVDSRGIVMNTYAFVCAAVPLLVGTPVMKYSQALGSFKTFSNRFLAKWILPKLELICARGRITESYLKDIGISENVRLCADGAFTMEDEPAAKKKVRKLTERDPFFKNGCVVGLSLSSVVEKKCRKLNIDYRKVMIQFINRLQERGFRVLIIANSARIHSKEPRNNDLMICDAVYDGIRNKKLVRWYHEEMTAEEIRELIGCCHVLVASRFHAMIGALQRKVPVLLVGWSHKYQEVLDFFELGQYAIDYTALTAESLDREFERIIKEDDEIRKKLEIHYDDVMHSSRQNIVYFIDALENLSAKR